jgi:hypothetical protein
MPPQVHPFVTSAMIKNNLIELTVELDHLDSGSYVEVSGSASQTGGAYANFYEVKEVPDGFSDTSGPNPSVTVSAHSLPPNRFRKGQDVTCVIRTGKIWLTVLGQGLPTETSSEDGSTKWNVIKAVSHITDDDSWNEEDDS